MHMADALLSPSVGLTMSAVTAFTLAYAVKKTAADSTFNDKKIPMMGIMGAFIFAAQMVNFTIPGTGSSGHIGGGILLAAVLGPWPALLTITAVLTIQALFFADGGLLALGCNIFNMGVCACLLGYIGVFRTIASRGLSAKRITAASVIAAVIGLQAGAFAVVLETLASGVTALPFTAFLLMMQPIHLAIGLTEGLITAAVLCCIYNARPEIIESALGKNSLSGTVSLKGTLASLALLTVVTASLFSLFASASPDGLEWAIERTAGTSELIRQGGIYDTLSTFVDKTAFMPDYSFPVPGTTPFSSTSAAGLAGSLMTLAFAGGAAALIGLFKRKKSM